MKTKETRLQKYINYSDVDFQGNYRISYLFNDFEAIATTNAALNGIWKQEMLNDYGWIVAKQTLTLDEPILLGEDIELMSVPGKGTFVTFPRYYYVYKEGKEVGRCSAIWTLLDLKNRRIVAPGKVGIEMPDSSEVKKLPTASSIQITEPLQYVETRTVRYADIDTNYHMNNTKYIDWVMDLIDLEDLKGKYLNQITIHYKKEIVPNTKVDLYMLKKDDAYIFEGKEKDVLFFQVELKITQK